MTDTADDIKPVALGGRTDYVAVARTAAKVITILGASIFALIPVYRSVTADSEARSQAAKNRAEAGYQLTKQAMEELQHRVLVLEEAAQKVQVAPPPKRGTRKPPPLPVAVTIHPKALPADLDKAERQVYRGATQQAPAKGPDAGDR